MQVLKSVLVSEENHLKPHSWPLHWEEHTEIEGSLIGALGCDRVLLAWTSPAINDFLSGPCLSGSTAFLPWKMKRDIFIIIPILSPAVFIEHFAEMMPHSEEPDMKVFKTLCNFFCSSLLNNFYSPLRWLAIADPESKSILQSLELMEFRRLAASNIRLRLNTKFSSAFEICPKFLSAVQHQYSGLETPLIRII